MIDTQALRGIWIGKGYTQEKVAKELGISKNTMVKKMKKGVFGSDEIEKMITMFDIQDPMRIFFTTKVTCKVT